MSVSSADGRPGKAGGGRFSLSGKRLPPVLRFCPARGAAHSRDAAVEMPYGLTFCIPTASGRTTHAVCRKNKAESLPGAGSSPPCAAFLFGRCVPEQEKTPKLAFQRLFFVLVGRFH